MSKRTRKPWTDAPAPMRCNALVRLKDNTEAQCGKWRNEDARKNPTAPTSMCTQHFRMFCNGKEVIDFRFRVPMRTACIAKTEAKDGL